MKTKFDIGQKVYFVKQEYKHRECKHCGSMVSDYEEKYWVVNGPEAVYNITIHTATDVKYVVGDFTIHEEYIFKTKKQAETACKMLNEKVKCQ